MVRGANSGSLQSGANQVHHREEEERQRQKTEKQRKKEEFDRLCHMMTEGSWTEGGERL